MAKAIAPATPTRTIHFRARDSGRRKTAKLATAIGISRIARKITSWTMYGRTWGPSHPGMKRIAADCTATIAVNERQDQQEDHGDAAEEVAPERCAELGLERRAGADRELREDIGDLQQTPGEQQVPIGHDQLGDLRAPRGAEERRDDGGEEEHDRHEEENQDEVSGRFLREKRDPGLVVGPHGSVLPGESRHPFHDFPLDVLDLHRPPQWGSATPCNQTSPIWRIIRPVPRSGRMNTWIQYHRRM